MSLKSSTTTKKAHRESTLHIATQRKTQTIEIRELDKRYTYANPKRGKCTMDGCEQNATHWLTRHNADYCQSDMICHQHAILWADIKELISKSEFAN